MTETVKTMIQLYQPKFQVMSKKNSILQVTCPHCGSQFSPEKAIEHSLRTQIEKEAKESITKQLRELESKAISLKETEAKMRSLQENFDLEVRKKLLAEADTLRKEAEKRAEERAAVAMAERERKLADAQAAFQQSRNREFMKREEQIRNEERMSRAELEKKLADASKLIERMERKVSQGSMQTQGEVQEIAIEEYLESTFPLDKIVEIAKGKRGADCLQVVCDAYGNECGRILYESKRTRTFGNDWLLKLKEDMRLKNADIGIIVTEVLPEGMTRFGEKDGIWICTFPEFKALAAIFRSQLLRIGEVTASNTNRGEKMNMVYEYVTSLEFRQKLEAAFEAYAEMQRDLSREKALFAQQWSKREKSIEKAMENLVSMYGDVRGIAGGAVQEIKALEMPELEVLTNQ